jgi:hypothetical protein
MGELDLWRKYRVRNVRHDDEMIGEREIDVLLLPASLAG